MEMSAKKNPPNRPIVPASKGESQSSDQAKQANRQDFQLQRALDLLRGVYFFNSTREPIR